jgi:hypothetical protein
LDDDQEKAFKLLKERMISAPLLTLPDFTKTFEVECDGSSIGIEVVLIQEKWPKPILMRSIMEQLEKWPKPILMRSIMEQLLIIQHMIKSCMHW